MVQGIYNGTMSILDTMGAYKEDGIYKYCLMSYRSKAGMF